MEKLKCSPLACMTFYVVIMTTVINFAISPLKENIKEVKTQVEKIRDLLTIKPQQILKTGADITASTDRSNRS